MEEWSTGSNTFYGSGKMRTEYGTIGFRNMELTLTGTVIGEMGKTNWNEFKEEKEKFEDNELAKTSVIYLVMILLYGQSLAGMTVLCFPSQKWFRGSSSGVKESTSKKAHSHG